MKTKNTWMSTFYTLFINGSTYYHIELFKMLVHYLLRNRNRGLKNSIYLKLLLLVVNEHLILHSNCSNTLSINSYSPESEFFICIVSHLLLTYQFNLTTNRLRDGGAWNADNRSRRIREAYYQLNRLRIEDMKSMHLLYTQE